MIADRAPVISAVESSIVQAVSSIDEQKSIIDEHSQLDRWAAEARPMSKKAPPPIA